MPDQEVLYEVKEGIACITLNRPEKLNAIDPPMRQLLWDSFQDVKNNPEVRCAIKGSEMGLEERVPFAQNKRNEVLESGDAKEGDAKEGVRAFA